MTQPLDQLTIRGFRSIEELDGLTLGSLTVLIGANGAGKSNFVGFFRMLRAMVEERLQAFTLENSPADGFFYQGVQQTKEIFAELHFGPNRYRFKLQPTPEGLMVADESTWFQLGGWWSLGGGRAESLLKKSKDDPGVTASRGVGWYVYQAIADWRVYHFHDTSPTAAVRRDAGVEQGERLADDAGNLAAFLFRIRSEEPTHYELIRSTIARVIPKFDDFVLRGTRGKLEDQVRLRWRQKGSDYVFSPGHLSDGSLRFVCLTTALLQPDPPTTVLIDEPELGLHPEALVLLAGLVRSVAKRTQVILATQSPVLLSEFEPEEVVTVDAVGGASRFRRLDADRLEAWLDDYSLGELWQKGTIAGGLVPGAVF